MAYTTLISTDTLATHLSNPTFFLADCRYNLSDEHLGHAAYGESHIPGAVFVNVGRDLAGARTGANGRHPLPSPADIAKTFGRLGITTNMQVVAYDHDIGTYASRLWWMLKYVGHDAVAVLDGGWAKWLREGRPVRGGEETRSPAAFAAQLKSDMHVTIDEVVARLNDPSMLLVDARSPQRFEGQNDPLDKVPGHIPGARNRFYKSNLADDCTMRPASDLRGEFLQVFGDRPASDVVMYCGSGITACENLLAMEHAGLHGARLFVGSWSEWESDPKRPIERKTENSNHD